jgi:hypothetical protein
MVMPPLLPRRNTEQRCSACGMKVGHFKGAKHQQWRKFIQFFCYRLKAYGSRNIKLEDFYGNLLMLSIIGAFDTR